MRRPATVLTSCHRWLTRSVTFAKPTPATSSRPGSELATQLLNKFRCYGSKAPSCKDDPPSLVCRP